MPVTEFAIIPLKHANWTGNPAAAPQAATPRRFLDNMKTSLQGVLSNVFCFVPPPDMQASPEVPRPASHNRAKTASGHNFRIFQQVQNPSLIHIIGKWDSTEAHTDFISSPANHGLIELLDEDITGIKDVPMWHLDADVFGFPSLEASWLLSATSVVYQRYSVTRENKDIVAEGVGHLIPFLRDSNCAVGGWRMEKEAEDKEEWILVSSVRDVVINPEDQRLGDRMQAAMDLSGPLERRELKAIEGL